jgi:putative FmdB family regulatory protein
MPLYEYQCEPCGHRFEVIQKFSDAPIEVCPKCGGAVAKLLSSPAIQFKGSGWYVTDYARAGKTDSANAGASTSKNESGTSSSEASPAKTEAKPEPKPKATASSNSD